MGVRSRERRRRRAWLATLAMPFARSLATRVQKARPRVAYRLAVNLGWFMSLFGFGRKIIRRNLVLACGRDVSRAELRAFEARYFRHLGLLLVEFLRLPTFDLDTVQRCFEPEGLEKIREVYARGDGVIFVAGHAGIWELAAHVVGLLGCKLLGVAKLSGHPEVDSFVTSLRESNGGLKVRDVVGSMWPMKKTLDRGEAIGINIDQEARKGAVFAPFFGVLASTSSTPALLHLVTGAPIVMGTVQRTGPFRYRLVVYDVIEHEPTGDRPADILEITTRINASTEEAIRRYPEQWLWSHRRWRRRPPGEATPFDRKTDATLELELGAKAPLSRV